MFSYFLPMVMVDFSWAEGEHGRSPPINMLMMCCVSGVVPGWRRCARARPDSNPPGNRTAHRSTNRRELRLDRGNKHWWNPGTSDCTW